MPSLMFQLGKRTLFRYNLRPGRTLVGRGSHCDVALPDATVSRVHCFVDTQDGTVVLVDRSSRHGTRLGGEAVEGRTELAHGDVLEIGPYRVTVDLRASEESSTPTATTSVAMEQLVGSESDGTLLVRIPSLKVTGGPAQGRSLELMRPVNILGGEGADLVLDPLLPRTTASVHVSPQTGEVTLEAHEAPAYLLGGHRVRGRMAIWDGDTFRLGPHEILLQQTITRRTLHARSFGRMLSASIAVHQVFGYLERLTSDANPGHRVLVHGESGTGKELVARGLHELGPRRKGPFIPLNCGAISASLFESELFGHEKGAFTGATSRKDGAFHKADGGTLFLDEVGELPLELQPKLLRTLEDGVVRRVGGTSYEQPDVRVVAATHRNLWAMAEEGSFRHDLAFRLSMFMVTLPPLRERREDVALMVKTILEREGMGRVTISSKALARLESHAWPGNVRELQNVMIRALTLREGDVIQAGDIQLDTDTPSTCAPGPETRQARLDMVQSTWRKNQGNVSATARELGMKRPTVYYWLREAGVMD